jgi:hypothetical protein
MDVSNVLRFSAAALMLLSGILHLVGGLILSVTDITTLAVGAGFGVIYIIIGIGLFVGRRLFTYLGVIFPLIGGIGGTYAYVTGQMTSTLVLVAIDVIVILCCAYLLLHRKS